jgi:excisionase family DNA binding protein
MSSKKKQVERTISIDDIPVGKGTRIRIEVDGMLLTPDSGLENFMIGVLQEYQASKEVPEDDPDLYVTSQKAADLVGVSRPTLVKLLKQYRVPVMSTGSHRRIKLKDVKRLQSTMRSRRDKAFQELIEFSEEVGLYELDWIENPLVRRD